MKTFYTIIGLLVACQSTLAANGQVVEKLLKENHAAISAVLQKQNISQEAKNQEIIEIVTPMFDFSLMAKLTLGRKYWPDLTPKQKERFTQLFIERLRNSYLNRLTLYTDEKIQYNQPITIKRKIHIPTNLIYQDRMISILYKFHKSGYSWKIYDLEIQGVSIIRSYRSQFHQIMKSGTFDDLLAKLEKPVAE